MTKDFNIWEGIYSSFSEAQAKAIGPGFSGDTYSARAEAVAIECLDALKLDRPIPGFHKQRSTLLPAIVAMMLEKLNFLRVLDFGGGLGIGYMTLSEGIPYGSECINYTIVEVPRICEQGRKLIPSIEFLDELPSSGKFSLVHSASTLQYVNNWQQVIKLLSNYDAEYILLSDVFAGNIPSYATLQNYYDSKIPHWILNIDELLAEFTASNYKLVMKSYVSSRRLDAEDILPMGNFPVTHQLIQTQHLLLRRVE